jgi:L,D-transpeptidase ErfK/SrfK
VKSNLLRRSLIFFCGGAAILLLLVQWRTAASRAIADTGTPPPPKSYRVYPLPKDGSQLKVDLSDRRVYFYRNNRLVSSYAIAIGQPGWETPIGRYQVIVKLKNPVWRHPITDEVYTQKEENPLGSRWIGFWYDERHYIGFHGTPDARLIGRPVSHGCVRMRNSDIQALYEQVGMGTPVLVQK